MAQEKGTFLKATASLAQLGLGGVTPAPIDAGPEPDARRAQLATWQMERLAQTHADLLASERYGPACQFFLSDLYAPRDFSRRDQEFQQLYRSLRRYLPRPLLRLLRDAIVLNELTRALDEALLAVLVRDLGLTDAITPQLYAEAYRRCDNYADRVRQLDLLLALGREVDVLVGRPLIGTVLRLAHGPAHRAGWGVTQSFLEKGFAAFKHMKGADMFLETVFQREKELLDHIYAGRSIIALPDTDATSAATDDVGS